MQVTKKNMDNLPPDFIEEEDELVEEDLDEILAECEQEDMSGPLLNDDQR